jgi:hypothetical protein
MAPGVDSASNRNEYQNLPGDKGRPERKADNLTAICEPIFKKMWDLRRLTTLRVSTACCKGIALPFLSTNIALLNTSYEAHVNIINNSFLLTQKLYITNTTDFACTKKMCLI